MAVFGYKNKDLWPWLWVVRTWQRDGDLHSYLVR